jgi:hypothetical protein
VPRLSTAEFNLKSLETDQHVILKTASLLDSRFSLNSYQTTPCYIPECSTLKRFFMLSAYLWLLRYFTTLIRVYETERSMLMNDVRCDQYTTLFKLKRNGNVSHEHSQLSSDTVSLTLFLFQFKCKLHLC